MTVRILNHTLEIISLLTGEDSLLQHLTNSRIKIELKKNRKTCQRILNHTLEIISVLTGEEYTIVKKKSPHSDIHQRAGECKDAAVSLSMEVWEQMEEHKYHLNSLGIPSHMSPGLRGDDLNTVSINEDGEYERDEKDILQVTIHSDTCAGLKCVVVPKLEQEEESAVKRLQPVKEEEIPVNISEVPSNLKPPIFSKSDQGKEMGVISYQEVKQESVNEGSCMNRNSEQHHSSHRSIQLGIGAIEVTEMYQEAIANRSPYRSKPVPDLDKELNSHVDINPTELGLATDKDYTSKEEATIYLNKKGKESTKEMENLENLLEVENSCEYSENSPSYNSELHIQQSILTTGKPFACSECGKSFRYKSKLVQHESVHTVEKPFTCAECGKCFKYKSNLVQHESVHTGVKPFACSECGKCFSQASYLVTHERTHTGEKSFECSECGKWFSRKSNLVHHEKTHTGDKPFTCSECGKCFRYKSNLVQHETVHTGVKPFSCSECGKYFRYKSELAHHESVHTCA